MTRTQLWQGRWPLVNEHVLASGLTCRETYEAADPEIRSELQHAFPCGECEFKTACLTAKRKELGPLLYDREFRTRPRSSESSLFPRELFDPLLRPNQHLVPYWLKPFGVEDRYGVATGWDIAWSEKIGGDWLVAFTGYVDRETGRKHVLDVGRWQAIPFDAQIELIIQRWGGEKIGEPGHLRFKYEEEPTRQRFPVKATEGPVYGTFRRPAPEIVGGFRDDLVAIENDFAQGLWIQRVRRDRRVVPVVGHSASNQQHLQQGIPGLLLELERGVWEFPFEPGSHHHDHMETFLSEAENFGWTDDKLEGVGEHDDTVFAWWHLSWALDMLLHGRTAAMLRRPAHA